MVNQSEEKPVAGGSGSTSTLAALGWDSRWAAVALAHDEWRSGWQPARVIRTHAGSAVLQGSGATSTVNTVGLYVGDWVLTDGVRAVALESRSELVRQSAGRTSHGQVLAANVDVVFVVEAGVPNPNRRRINRLLVLSASAGAHPVVVVTKFDAVQADERASARVDEVVGALARQGVDVITTSIHHPTDMARVASFLPEGRTGVFLGPSGVGKSSIMNALLGNESMRTYKVRSDGKGRHTTTHRELQLIPAGGAIIDTPGIRSVGLVGEDAAVDEVFPEIAAISGNCRYRDCTHVNDAGCAIHEALESGDLDRDRVEEYLSLQREIREHEARSSQRDRRDERNASSGRSRAMRVVMRAKGR